MFCILSCRLQTSKKHTWYHYTSKKKIVLLFILLHYHYFFLFHVLPSLFLFKHYVVSVFDVAFHALSDTCRVGYKVMVMKQSFAGRLQLSFGAPLVILISYFKGLLLKNKQ